MDAAIHTNFNVTPLSRNADGTSHEWVPSAQQMRLGYEDQFNPDVHFDIRVHIRFQPGSDVLRSCKLAIPSGKVLETELIALEYLRAHAGGGNDFS